MSRNKENPLDRDTGKGELTVMRGRERWVRVAGEKCDSGHHGFRGHVKPKYSHMVAKVRFL